MNFIPLVFGLGAPEVILIVLVFLLLFGAKRIPDLMKSLGKGVKNFKEGITLWWHGLIAGWRAPTTSISPTRA